MGLNNSGDVRIFTGAFIFTWSCWKLDESIGGKIDAFPVGDAILSVISMSMGDPSKRKTHFACLSVRQQVSCR
jgi:hypothetical protein